MDIYEQSRIRVRNAAQNGLNQLWIGVVNGGPRHLAALDPELIYKTQQKTPRHKKENHS